MMASHDDGASEAQLGPTGTPHVPGAALRRGPSRLGILHRIALGVVAAILMGLGIWILVAAVGAPGPAFARVGVAAIGLSISAAGLWFGVRALGAFGRRDADQDYSLRVKERAEQLGLPTDPEAYQDGGLGVAATAYGLERAEVVASVLRSAAIPAWVEGAVTAAWYWHMQFAMHPRGIRIMVPLGRLEEARTILQEYRQEASRQEDKEHATADQEDAHYQLLQSVRRLGYLTLIGLLAPLVFVLALRLLVRIADEREKSGHSADLARARVLALAIAFLACPLWGLFLGVIALHITKAVAF